MVVAFALLAAIAFAAPMEDLVTSLPQVGVPPFATYSGYLDIPATTKSLHYVFVES
jgi:hypothetical protein